jgi:CNT family concentrative nucleoside transporter
MVESILRGTLGISFLLLVAFIFSNNRKAIDWKLVASALTIQIVLALGILKVEFISDAFTWFSGIFLKVIDFTQAGSALVFGNSLIGEGSPITVVGQVDTTIMNHHINAVMAADSSGYIIQSLQSDTIRSFVPLAITTPDSVLVTVGKFKASDSVGYIFATRALPTIIFFSALSSVLYYLGILQRIVYGLAWAMQKVMRITGAESMAAAANVFMGQTEAPLVIKPYLARMTQSELLCLMVGGMATIAGGVLVAYVGFLGGSDKALQAEFAKHLLAASIMSAPAAILTAKILYPETDPSVNRDLTIAKEQIGNDLLDAISKGTTDGVRLAVNVAAMLIVFTALIAMLNYICSSTLGEIPIGTDLDGSSQTLNEYVQVSSQRGVDVLGNPIYLFSGFNIEYMLGWLLAPVAWLLGTPSQDILIVGQLLGKKTILNEFIAYADIPTVQAHISFKSKIILTYALCGFANFASIGIQIGGIGVLAENQRASLSRLGMRALLGGTIACFLTAAIAAMFIS